MILKDDALAGWPMGFFCGGGMGGEAVALMAGWDWWRGRLMRQFVVGAAGLLAAEYVAATLFFWGPWQATTLGWVEAWAKRFG